MKFSGWIFMLVSWGVIIWLFVYCMARTLGLGKKSEEKPDPSETAP